jgi:hypothetical protein
MRFRQRPLRPNLFLGRYSGQPVRDGPVSLSRIIKSAPPDVNWLLRHSLVLGRGGRAAGARPTGGAAYPGVCGLFPVRLSGGWILGGGRAADAEPAAGSRRVCRPSSFRDWCDQVQTNSGETPACHGHAVCILDARTSPARFHLHRIEISAVGRVSNSSRCRRRVRNPSHKSKPRHVSRLPYTTLWWPSA